VGEELASGKLTYVDPGRYGLEDSFPLKLYAIFRVQLLIYPQTFFASNLGCFPNPAREKSVSSHVKKVRPMG